MAKRTQVQSSGLYGRAEYEQLLADRRRLNDFIGFMDKLQACGIECDTMRVMRDNIDKQLEAIQHHFMTPAPTA